jgi:four helix bundle protein
MVYYHDLLVWQKAHELAIEIYRVTKDFPKSEVYALTNQLRRAATSVPANIVEGNTKRSAKDKSRFLETARGSLAETEYFIELSKELGYVKRDISMTESLIKQTGILLWKFQKSLH